MQITLQQLTDSFISLGKLASLDLPAKQAYWLSRLAKAAESEMKQLDELRVKLVKKYGEEGEDGTIAVKPENVEAFGAEWGDVLAESVELPGDGIALDSLGDIKISAIDLMRLDWLFTDNKPEQAQTAGA